MSGAFKITIAIIVLASLGGGLHHLLTQHGKPSAATSVPGPVTPVALTPQQLVAKIALTSGDLPGAPNVMLMQDGDQVTGQVTLDNCGYDFTSEAHRTARTQLEIGGPSGLEVSNEVVAYDSPADAAEALAQFRRSVTGCAAGTVARSTVEGVPPLRFNSSRLIPGVRLPISDNATASEIVSDTQTGQQAATLMIFQRRGAVLDGVYLTKAAGPLTLADVATGQTYAKAAGQKLANGIPGK